MHFIKITNVQSDISTYVGVTQCIQCHGDTMVPEPFLSWYIRSYDPNPDTLKLACKDCGGPVLDDYIHFNKAWSAGPETINEQNTIPHISDVAVERHRDWRVEYDDSRDNYMGFHSHVSTYVSPFEQALTKLKTFMIKE